MVPSRIAQKFENVVKQNVTHHLLFIRIKKGSSIVNEVIRVS